MPSFTNKLNQNDLYPRLPGGGGEEDLFGRFLRMQRGRLGPQPQMMAPQQSNYQPRDFLRNPMDVKYQPSLSDLTQARLSPTAYQAGQLGLKERELALKGSDINTDNQLAQQKLGINQQQIDINKIKAEKPAKFIIDKIRGTLSAVDPVSGQLIKDLGPTQMREEDLINLNQTNKLGVVAAQGSNQLANTGAQGANALALEGQRQIGRETIEQARARHAVELANLNNANKPVGTVQTREIMDASGNVTGSSTTRNTQQKNINLPAQSPQANAPIKPSIVMMWGPDGKQYPIPLDKVTYETKRGMTTKAPGAK